MTTGAPGADGGRRAHEQLGVGVLERGRRRRRRSRPSTVSCDGVEGDDVERPVARASVTVTVAVDDLRRHVVARAARRRTGRRGRPSRAPGTGRRRSTSTAPPGRRRAPSSAPRCRTCSSTGPSSGPCVRAVGGATARRRPAASSAPAATSMLPTSPAARPTRVRHVAAGARRERRRPRRASPARRRISGGCRDRSRSPGSARCAPSRPTARRRARAAGRPASSTGRAPGVSSAYWPSTQRVKPSPTNGASTRS